MIVKAQVERKVRHMPSLVNDGLLHQNRFQDWPRTLVRPLRRKHHALGRSGFVAYVVDLLRRDEGVLLVLHGIIISGEEVRAFLGIRLARGGPCSGYLDNIEGSAGDTNAFNQSPGLSTVAENFSGQLSDEEVGHDGYFVNDEGDDKSRRR